MIPIQGIPDSLNRRTEEIKKLNSMLDKYIYLSDKIQNEIVHWDTLKLFRKIESDIIKQINSLKKEFEK